MDITEALKGLSKNERIRGGLLITQEGMVVTSALGPEQNPDTFAAFYSSVCLTLSKSLKSIGIDTFHRYLLSAGDSRLFIANIGKLYLVVITDRDANLSEMNVDLYQIESLIRKTGRLD